MLTASRIQPAPFRTWHRERSVLPHIISDTSISSVNAASASKITKESAFSHLRRPHYYQVRYVLASTLASDFSSIQPLLISPWSQTQLSNRTFLMHCSTTAERRQEGRVQIGFFVAHNMESRTNKYLRKKNLLRGWHVHDTHVEPMKDSRPQSSLTFLQSITLCP